MGILNSPNFDTVLNMSVTVFLKAKFQADVDYSCIQMLSLRLALGLWRI